MLERSLNRLVALSVRRPWLVIGLTIAATAAFATRFPSMIVDTDPTHMLPATSAVRQYNDEVEREFALHADVILLGVVNDAGVINPRTLARIETITREIERIPGVVSRDVLSFSTADDVSARDGELIVRPLLDRVPESDADLAAFRDRLLGNPLFEGRLASRDATVAAIYVPLEPTANGKEVAERIREILPADSGGDRYLLAGDPLARDTFGAEMFRQMALFSPIAGLVMCAILWLMFRSALLIVANMAVAMVSIVWSMGLLIGLGFPVHIMSSMSPVFLMAIATDSVHIFNELSFRTGEVADGRRTVLDTMATVGLPVFYSDVTTAAGFASLAAATIVPVQVFGIFVAFGTLVILLMSFTLVPAILVLVRPGRLPVARRPAAGAGRDSRSLLALVGERCVRHAWGVAAAGGILLALAAVGLSRSHVNNNLIHWFKPNSPIRTADRVLNDRLGGTSTAYLVVQGSAADAMKDPAVLRRIEALQRDLERDPRVGTSLSVADYVKRVNRVLHDDDPAEDRVPDSAEAVGQYLFLLGSSARPSTVDNVVDYPFQKANVFVQLKTWDAAAMADVVDRVQRSLAADPFPGGVTVRPAGIAYFNLVWNREVLRGMIESFLVGLVLVAVLLAAQLRSLLWGGLAFLPLAFTVLVIYGAVGLTGKDFDMPVAVLSTLSLGLAIDFAIHFVGRLRERCRTGGRLREALVWTVARPGKGILLNAVLFASGFGVMVFADLTPYVTVGVFMAAIMLLSAATSVIGLPALIHLLRRPLFRRSSAAALAAVVLALAATAQGREAARTDSAALTAEEIVERSQQAFYYAGDDLKARISMSLLTETGKRRTRVLTMLRKDYGDGGEQRYFLYFHEPGDVRRTAFVVWKYPERDDDRWIFIPAVNAIRRIAASDSRSSFVGSDFTYEDVSGRDVSADTHALLREERLGTADCYVIESVPKSRADYTRKLSWIDKATFLPLREEYYDARNELARLFTADEVKDVAAGKGPGGRAYPTVTKRTMRSVKRGHLTEVTFLDVSYDIGLDDGTFTDRALQSPPRQWLR